MLATILAIVPGLYGLLQRRMCSVAQFRTKLDATLGEVCLVVCLAWKMFCYAQLQVQPSNLLWTTWTYAPALLVYVPLLTHLESSSQAVISRRSRVDTVLLTNGEFEGRHGVLKKPTRRINQDTEYELRLAGKSDLGQESSEVVKIRGSMLLRASPRCGRSTMLAELGEGCPPPPPLGQETTPFLEQQHAMQKSMAEQNHLLEKLQARVQGLEEWRRSHTTGGGAVNQGRRAVAVL